MGQPRRATTTTRTETYRDNQGRRRRARCGTCAGSPPSGVVEHFFDDEPVPGRRVCRTTLLEQVEPFPTAELVPYDTAFLSGFVVEHYQIVLLDAARALASRR